MATVFKETKYYANIIKLFSLQHIYILIITTYTLNKVHISTLKKFNPKWYILLPSVYISTI